jgi:mannose/fructose/N-acetylgalactosamine-specific phosphotransferase system component IID
MSEATLAQQETPDPEQAHLPKSVLNKSFWRFFWSFQISWNYERDQALGFLWAMIPVLRHLNPDDNKFIAAMQRHITFFNTSPVVGGPLILGTAIAMEEGGSPSAAESVKVAMMGPLAGIGDTVTYALYNSIILTLGASWALSGSSFGPIFAAVMCLIPLYFLRRWQFNQGYAQGRNLITQLAAGALAKVSEGATIVGLIVLGGFIPSVVGISTNLQISEKAPSALKGAKATITYIQTDLDAILPFLLPVLVTALIYFLMRRFNLHPLWCILIIFVLGIVLGGVTGLINGVPWFSKAPLVTLPTS